MVNKSDELLILLRKHTDVVGIRVQVKVLISYFFSVQTIVISPAWCPTVRHFLFLRHCQYIATRSVISQSLRVAISFNSATKILSFSVLFCDICQYRNKISDFFEYFLRYGKYRKKGQKDAKICVALLGNYKTHKPNQNLAIR